MLKLLEDEGLSLNITTYRQGERGSKNLEVDHLIILPVMSVNREYYCFTYVRRFLLEFILIYLK